MSTNAGIPDKMDLRSMDISAENRAKMKQLFPSVFTETRNKKGELVESIDFEKLKAELGNFTDVFESRRERYGMDWPGKKDCMKVIQQPSIATLKPCRTESVNFDTTENLFIEGDNLEVLKLLQKSYYGKVKMIYIDPPYNTGKEFIYPDNYTESLDTYLAYAGMVDDEGRRFSTNTPNEGRFHTKWLNMMYPRLYLARNLLREDGFIVVSIDDTEVSNLNSILNDVFGEENKVAVLVWDKNRKNDAKFFSVGHEYMLIYAKNKQLLIENKIMLREQKKGIDAARAFYEELRRKHKENWSSIQAEWREFFRKLPSSDPKKKLGRFAKVGPNGPYRDDGNISWPGGGGPIYDIKHPLTKKPCKIPDGGWRYSSPEKFWEEVEAGRVVFGPDETTLPRQLRYLFGNKGQVMPSVFYSYAQTATMEFLALMEDRVFDNPKNWKDIRRLISYICGDSDFILDFFSGSCTTAHAVLDLNKQDGGRRKFIMVQLPEPCEASSEAYKANYKTVADVGKERIRRVIQKITQETYGNHEKHEKRETKQLSLFDKNEDDNALDAPNGSKNLDLGFKVFKLDRSTFKIWNGPDTDASEEKIIQQLAAHVEHIDPAASQEDILHEILLKAGFMLTEKVERRELAGKTVFAVSDGALLICLEDEITHELIDAVVEAKPHRFICLDRGFHGNDQLKANAVQTFAALNQGQDEEAEQIVFRTV
ncbi:MAG: site-specific DNA-methyltransferase [bacterium]